MDEALVGLADAVAALRAELSAAVAEGQDQGMQFALDPIELTVQAVITKDVSGKIGWKVLEAGASYESSRTQTLKLTLVPMWKKSDGTRVQDFTIADGQAVAGTRDRAGPKPDVDP